MKTLRVLISFFKVQNRRLQTSDFVFDAPQNRLGGKQQLSMRMNVSEGKYLEFSYALAPNSYKVEYALNLVGLEGLIQSNTPIKLIGLQQFLVRN